MQFDVFYEGQFVGQYFAADEETLLDELATCSFSRSRIDIFPAEQQADAIDSDDDWAIL